MTSPSKALANRKNALLSTGPRTPAGKAHSSKNALRHGLLVSKPYLPEVEDRKDWTRHLDGVVDALAPVGHLEETLVERVAVTLWRLGRVTRYEREVLALAQESASMDVTEERSRKTVSLEEARAKNFSPLLLELVKARHMPVSEVIEELDFRRSVRESVLSFMARDAAKLVPAQEAEDVLFAVQLHLREAGVEVDWEAAADEVWEETEDADEDWTKVLVAKTARRMAEKAGKDPETLLDRTFESSERAFLDAAGVGLEASSDLDRERRRRLLPEEDVLQRVSRYEAHLERSLFRTLHELERLQARREGAPFPPRAVLDVTVEGAGGEA